MEASEYCSISIIDGKIIVNNKKIIKKRKLNNDEETTEHGGAKHEIPFVTTVKEELQENFLSKDSIPENQDGVESKFATYDEIIKEETECPNCAMEFLTVENLNAHINACHTAHRCDICFKQLKSKSGLDRHLKSHLKPPKSFQCELCSEQILRRAEFKKHLLTHNVGTQFVCELCPYVCTTKRALKDHHINVHMQRFKPLRFIPCGKCMLSFRSQEAFDEHQLYHLKMEQNELLI